MIPRFFIVATPIGNRDDITTRALQVLGEANFIVAEDTRHTGQLLSFYGIKKPFISFRDAPAPVIKRSLEAILERLDKGETGAYVTDAGTPGVSDPGWRLVHALLEKNITVSSLPGPSAVTTLVSLAATPLDEYRFLGFLPKKKGFQTKLDDIVSYLDHKEARAVVFYESPKRVQETLTDLAAKTSGLHALVGRELTKKFEEYLRGKPAELLQATQKRSLKGEFVVMIAPGESH